MQIIKNEVRRSRCRPNLDYVLTFWRKRFWYFERNCRKCKTWYFSLPFWWRFISKSKYKLPFLFNYQTRRKRKSTIQEFHAFFWIKINQPFQERDDVWNIFQQMVRMVRTRRNLNYDDRMRFIIQNESLDKPQLTLTALGICS